MNKIINVALLVAIITAAILCIINGENCIKTIQNIKKRYYKKIKKNYKNLYIVII